MTYYVLILSLGYQLQRNHISINSTLCLETAANFLDSFMTWAYFIAVAWQFGVLDLELAMEASAGVVAANFWVQRTTAPSPSPSAPVPD